MKKEIKSILFSIKPEFVEKIFNGDKTVELRRVLPRSLFKSTEIIIYATSPTKCIVGIAVIKKVESNTPDKLWRKLGTETGISYKYFKDYFSGRKLSYALVLEKVKKIEPPISLEKLRDEINFNPPQSFMYASKALLEVMNKWNQKLKKSL